MIKTCMGVVLVTAALLGANVNAAVPDVPAAAFAALPQVSHVSLSPDGRLLAWRDLSGAQPKILVLDIAARSYRQTLSIGPGMALRSLGWADDGTLLTNLSQVRTSVTTRGLRRYTFYRTLSVDIASGKSQMLLMSGGWRESITGAELVAGQTTKPHTVTMSSWDYSLQAASERAAAGWISELFQVDTKSGKGTSAFDRKVVDRSPVRAAAAIQAPVLLFHAVDDTYVRITQSQKMASALASLGKPVTLVKLRGDDWLSNAGTRLQVLEDTDRFLRQYLK